MTNTLETLDQFTQALGSMLPRAAGCSLTADPAPAWQGAARSDGAVPSGRLTGGMAVGTDARDASGAARGGHRHGAAGPGSLRPPASSPGHPVESGAGLGRGALSPNEPLFLSSAPTAPAAVVRADGAEKRSPAIMRSEGITRQGSRCDWPRWVRLGAFALMIGLGLTHVVRATGRAGESCWRQAVARSLAARQNDSPASAAARKGRFHH